MQATPDGTCSHVSCCRASLHANCCRECHRSPPRAPKDPRWGPNRILKSPRWVPKWSPQGPHRIPKVPNKSQMSPASPEHHAGSPEGSQRLPNVPQAVPKDPNDPQQVPSVTAGSPTSPLSLRIPKACSACNDVAARCTHLEADMITCRGADTARSRHQGEGRARGPDRQPVGHAAGRAAGGAVPDAGPGARGGHLPRRGLGEDAALHRRPHRHPRPRQGGAFGCRPSALIRFPISA